MELQLGNAFENAAGERPMRIFGSSVSSTDIAQMMAYLNFERLTCTVLIPDILAQRVKTSSTALQQGNVHCRVRILVNAKHPLMVEPLNDVYNTTCDMRAHFVILSRIHQRFTFLLKILSFHIDGQQRCWTDE